MTSSFRYSTYCGALCTSEWNTFVAGHIGPIKNTALRKLDFRRAVFCLIVPSIPCACCGKGQATVKLQ